MRSVMPCSFTSWTQVKSLFTASSPLSAHTLTLRRACLQATERLAVHVRTHVPHFFNSPLSSRKAVSIDGGFKQQCEWHTALFRHTTARAKQSQQIHWQFSPKIECKLHFHMFKVAHREQNKSESESHQIPSGQTTEHPVKLASYDFEFRVLLGLYSRRPCYGGL